MIFITKNTAPTFREVQAKVVEMISGRILVGHSVDHALSLLGTPHPRAKTRDTSQLIQKIQYLKLMNVFYKGLHEF